MYVELRHLRYFIAVAEELNFSRAAARLHIAQPALSAQIRALERNLGCKLLERTTRRVELTAHGRTLLEDAREVVRLADEAVSRLRASVRGERGVLRVGFIAHGAGELGTAILKRFADTWPHVTIELEEAGTLEALQRGVRDRATDVAFAWLPLVHDELVAAPIRAERVLVAVSGDHPLAALAAPGAADVAAGPIVAPWDGVPFGLLEPWVGPFRPGGRRPGDPNGTSVDECLAVASHGLAAYLVPDSVARYYARPGVVFRPVAGVAPGQVAVVRRRDVANPAVAGFVEVARSEAAAAEIQNDSF
ncbi:MAG: LysR family transcriptional regulator [Thermoleophilia bacterium]|nr:LysR family transcriptional regulator [Thermoleophilia bacterium]